jgi:hypothetical protein
MYDSQTADSKLVKEWFIAFVTVDLHNKIIPIED